MLLRASLEIAKGDVNNKKIESLNFFTML